MGSAGSFEPIDFGGLAAALLDQIHTLVPRWLPYGVERSGRWYVGDFDGADGESANVNLATGQWIDNGAPDEDVGGDLLSLYRRVNNHPTMLAAARAVMAEMGWQRAAAGAVRARAASSGPLTPEQALAQLHGESAVPVGFDAPGASERLPDEPDLVPTHRANVQSTAARKADRWRSVLPVPPHAPVPRRFVHGFKDKTRDEWVEQEAVTVWEWVFGGERFGYTARFERTNSKGELVKDVLPLTWCEDTHDARHGQRWHWKQWAAPRPLYVPRQALSDDASRVPVVLVEGEKKALAGHGLLGAEFDFVCWPGGAKAWALARWQWLQGRTVYLWPDADAQRVALTRDEREHGVDPGTKPYKSLAKQAGFQAMQGIGTLLLAELGCTVLMLPMDAPGVKPDGWDLADAIAEGWDAGRVRDHIRAARVFVPVDEGARAAVGDAGISTPSRAPAEDGDEDPNWGWRRHLLTSKTGSVLPVRENVAMALDGWPEKGVPGIAECQGLIAFNEFSNNIEKRRPTPWGTPAGDWQEADELQMGSWLVRTHFMPSTSRQALEEAVQTVAKAHRFHPVREKFEALRGRYVPARSRPLLDTWLSRVLLDECSWDDDPLLQQYLALSGKWFLMAMVARVMTEKRLAGRVVCGPGTKFDYMLILEGPQGWGKSSFAKVLGGDYFADTGLEIGAKDSLMNIQGVLVYEWGELENLTRQEVGKIKLFISSPEDRFRATFDRRPAKYPRQVVFVGTTNESHYLTDTTGNRRFWPVKVTRPPDLDWLREHMDALLAEAVFRVDEGERFWPLREEQQRLFDPQQSARTVESSLEAKIRQLLHDEDQVVPHGRSNLALVNQVGMQELLDRVGYTIDKQTDAVVKKAGALMHMLGWEVKRTSLPGRPRVYVRPAYAPAGDTPADRSHEALPSGSLASGPVSPATEPDAGDEPPF